jgi:hypothetical protein
MRKPMAEVRAKRGSRIGVDGDASRDGGESIGLIAAARARPSRIIIPIVVLVVIALIVGVARPATYTAHATLAVGRIDVSAVAAPGVVSASQSLASAYSRAIGADDVTEQVKKEVPNPGSVSASPIPESPVILIESEASSEGTAVKTANAAGDALIAYINQLNSNVADSERLLKAYEEAKTEEAKLESELTNDAAGTEGADLAKARLSVEELKVNASEAAYRATLEEDTSGNDLRVLTSAQEASSDRKSVLKLLLFAAVLAGAGIGLVWAYVESVRKSARRPPRRPLVS